MTKTVSLSLLALAALTTTAAAETNDMASAPQAGTYVALGGSLGSQRGFQTGLHLDAGRQIGESPFFMHGSAAYGASGSDGTFTQLRGGAEARGCVRSNWLCGFAGLDLGYQHDDFRDDPTPLGITTPVDEPQMEIENAHDLLAVPRVGAELGKHLRLRATLEFPGRVRLNETETSNESKIGGGVTAMLGMGYAF
jgi:hypothetical protein